MLSNNNNEKDSSNSIISLELSTTTEDSDIINDLLEKEPSIEMQTKRNLSRNENCCMFLYIKDYSYIIIVPHWPFTLCLLTIINIICILYFFDLKDRMKTYIWYIGVIIYLIEIISYTLCGLINPGTLDKIYYLENYDFQNGFVKNLRICKKCKIIMDLDKNTEHCLDCDICVMGCAHHCPWTSKCVGAKNLYFFYCFISFVVIITGYFMSSVMYFIFI